MSSTYLARTVLNTRLDALATAREDVNNQIGFFNERLGEQYGRETRILDEQRSILEAIQQLEDQEQPIAPAEELDDCPF